MTVVLVGSTGVLGSGFREALQRSRRPAVSVHPDWRRPGTVAQALQPHLEGHAWGGASTTLVWAAGVGGVGSTRSGMEAESAGLSALADGIRRLPERAAERVRLVFASSAGAVYAGHGSSPVDESSPVAPTSDYGQVKLEQEALLGRLAEQTGCRVLVCRYSNVYGLASARLTARGLVSTAVRATRYRQPMSVYVSPDSRRDYVLATDAAAWSLERSAELPVGLTTALVCDGETRTVSSVIALVGHVAGRRVPATYGERRETRLQPRVLRFAAHLGRAGVTGRTPMETAVHRMMRAPLA